MTTLGGSSPQIRRWNVVFYYWNGPGLLFGPGEVHRLLHEWQGDMAPERAFGGLACLLKFGESLRVWVWQCEQRQNSGGVWWHPTFGWDRLMPRLLSFWHGPANGSWLLGVGTLYVISFQTFCVGSEYCLKLQLDYLFLDSGGIQPISRYISETM